MDIFLFFVFFLLLIVPGIFADRVYNLVSRLREASNIFTSLIFSLFVFLINITGLFIFKGIFTMTALIASFDCLQFTRRYGLLSLLVAAILGAIFGILRRFANWIQD